MKVFLYIFSCLFFVVLGGFFAGSEIAFISSRILYLRRLQKRDRKARKAHEILSNPERFLATTLVGTNVCVVISSTLATYLLVFLGIKNSNLWVTFLFTPVVVIFAELVPKTAGRYYREEWSILTAEVFKFFETVFSPLIYFIERVSGTLVRIILGKKGKKPFVVTREDIKAMALEVEKAGLLERGEREAIEDIFGFGRKKVKDVCVPFNRVAAIDYTDPLNKLLDMARTRKFTRYPVFRNKEIVGYINIFDLFYSREKEWYRLVRPITHLGVSQKLYESFSILRGRKENIAVVVKGKKEIGIVTLEDLMKEILESIVK